MTYVARHNGEESEAFAAAMGILIGDTCSPVLWALFMSDLPDFIPKDGDDIVLGGVAVRNVEQADDVLLMSSTPEGLLRKLKAMFRWCQKNFLLFNTVKSVVMIFGRRPTALPVFDLGEGGRLEVVREHTYLGFQIASSGSGMMRLHYDAKKATAETVSRVIWVFQQLSGAMPVAMLTMLYMALVDPHLVRGLLEKVQKQFLRRVLELGPLSLVAVLFTETGLEPLRYRRLLLAIDYLLYILHSPCVYVKLALREVVDLDQRGYPTWVSSLRSVVRALPGQVEFPPPGGLLLEARIERLQKDVERSMDRVLQGEVDGTDRLGLIHGRMEVDPDGGPARQVVRMRRHYLALYNPGHRKVLARVLLGSHNFATARRRYTHGTVWGLRCRFCEEREESVVHVWMICGANDAIVRARRDYILKIGRSATPGEVAYIRSLNSVPSQQLRALLDLRSVTSATAEYAYVVQEIAEKIGLAPLDRGLVADAGEHEE
ncbi:hypothetical protein D9611_011800 [Ephemerocybe angulata]|uniref:Reverse transcriptase domain-containing protein n=1 Tax=Ephemerocybe angulata TaxID=980116 RepID=A0A8H5FBY3_9AGAR|nr:hypothetical protein D9611_011800 [Tulosesus angulatus]